MTSQPYQMLPPLTAEEYAALRADIETNGIRVPVDVDESGQILDGHHRQAIATELGIDCPTRVLTGLTEDDKRAHALAVNIHRRTLSISQRRALVTAELDRDPSRSDRAIGRLCGVDGKTVAAMRQTGVRNSAPADQPITAAEIARARELTDYIREKLNALDVDVLTMLLTGQPPAQIAGELAVAWHKFEQLFADQADLIDAIRGSVFTQRISDILSWPEGWYADECRRAPELHGFYTAALTTAEGRHSMPTPAEGVAVSNAPALAATEGTAA